jgi:hypothetical protein
MKILSYGISMYNRSCHLQEVLNVFKVEVLDALSIENRNGSNGRGVLVHEQVKINKKVLSISQKINNILAAFFKLFGIKTKQKKLVNKDRFANRIRLYPENSNYPGFILNFQHYCECSYALVMQLTSSDQQVVISNHTNYEAKDHYGRRIAGTLIVIHCEESTKQRFDFISSSVEYSNGKCNIFWGTANIHPANPGMQDDMFKLDFDIKNSILTSDLVFKNLMEMQDNDLNQVRDILLDPELSNLYITSIKEANSLILPESKHEYTSSSVI